MILLDFTFTEARGLSDDLTLTTARLRALADGNGALANIALDRRRARPCWWLWLRNLTGFRVMLE